MNSKLEKHVIVIKSGLSNKRRKMKKPWWTDELSHLWNDMCKAESEWKKCRGPQKANSKCIMKSKQKVFDRVYQKEKRQYWKKSQEKLLEMQSHDPQEFWKYIGQLGVAKERKENIPWEVINNDGSVSSDRREVLLKWANDFQGLLNPDVESATLTCDTTQGQGEHQNLIDTGLNDPVSLLDVRKALHKAKLGRATGFDQIPVETLKSDTAVKFLHRLFHVCFEQGITPSLWSKGIINPIPKNSSNDPRDPLSYRGITLASSVYKLYCCVLNDRLVNWAEINQLIIDEQNGFRKKRSCVDQLSTITQIIETRKQQRKSTFTVFIDFSKAYDRVNRELLWSKLSHMGLTGKMLQALQQIYQDVQCCVRINGIYSDWFQVSCGLKQGCLISPILFNLYINDLAVEIKQSGKGVDIDGERIALLMFADDIVCLAENEMDLQAILDIVYLWCNRWKMKINVEKTKVVHFRGKSVAQTQHVFHIGDSVLEVVQRYKYLGLILTETLDYSVTATMVAQAAGRALGLLIAKSKASGGMPYNVFSHLYDTLVQPVINYGAAVWGTQEFSCINAVQHRACRYFIGVGRYTPNPGTQGDMGWKLAPHQQWLPVTRHWCRLINMDENRLNKRVFVWSCRAAGGARKNWCWRVKHMFEELGLPYICDTSTGIDAKAAINDVDAALSDYYEARWLQQVNQEGAKRGPGKNKLRTYCKFKSNIQTEPYLYILVKSHRSAIAKFRCGVAPIRLETGRYEQLAPHERLCPLCQTNSIESEEHVILECNIYDDIRHNLFHHAVQLNPAFMSLSNEEKLCFILANPDMSNFSAKACHLILARRRTLMYN